MTGLCSQRLCDRMSTVERPIQSGLQSGSGFCREFLELDSGQYALVWLQFFSRIGGSRIIKRE